MSPYLGLTLIVTAIAISWWAAGGFRNPPGGDPR